MRNMLHIQTPENVTLDFELGGIGSRGVALAIDMVIQYLFLAGVILTVFFLNGITFDEEMAEENTFYIVMLLLIVFVVQVGYFLLFEFFMKGSTPGKKLVGLKVIMASGEPLSFSAALIRNFIRLADMLPGMYGIGIFSVLFSKRFMRVGDLAANTVVVKTTREKGNFAELPKLTNESAQMQLSKKEEALLIDYFHRKRSVKNPLSSSLLEAQLYHHFYGKIGLVPNLPQHFSRRIYLEKLMEWVGLR